MKLRSSESEYAAFLEPWKDHEGFCALPTILITLWRQDSQDVQGNSMRWAVDRDASNQLAASPPRKLRTSPHEEKLRCHSQKVPVNILLFPLLTLRVSVTTRNSDENLGGQGIPGFSHSPSFEGYSVCQRLSRLVLGMTAYMFDSPGYVSTSNAQFMSDLFAHLWERRQTKHLYDIIRDQEITLPPSPSHQQPAKQPLATPSHLQPRISFP